VVGVDLVEAFYVVGCFYYEYCVVCQADEFLLVLVVVVEVFGWEEVFDYYQADVE